MSSTNNNPWFSVSVGLIGLIVGYTLATSNPGTGGGAPTPTPTPSQPTAAAPRPPAPSGDPASADDDAFLGDKNAPVTLIEFTDYECPFCGRFFSQTLPEIKSEYIETGKVKYVVRDFPLSFHQNAQKASEATECAEEQDKFWEYHDLLYANQRALTVPSLKQYAVDLGLDSSKFDDCLDSDKYAEEVKKDMADGSASGVSGTPGFWVVGADGKGQRLSGAQPFASFKAAIDAQL